MSADENKVENEEVNRIENEEDETEKVEQPPQIDLEQLKRERLGKAIPEILKLFGKIENLIPPNFSEESEKLFNEAASKFYEEMLIIFSKNGIVREDFSSIFANIKAMIDVIETTLKNQVGQMMNEILTTIINVKDPLGGNDIAYAKHTDIAEAVLNLRKQYGGDENNSNYFKIVETPKDDGSIPSPVDMTKPE